MSTNPNPSNSADNDDSWEELAESLFGTAYGKEHSTSAGFTDEPAPPVEAPRPPAAEQASPAPTPAPAVPPPPDEEEETAEVVISEVVETEIEVQQMVLEDAGDALEAESERDEPRTATPAEKTAPSDTYWDALANWSWDDAGSGSRERAPRSGDRGGRPERSERSGGRPPRGGGGTGGPRSGSERRERPAGSEASERRPAPAAPVRAESARVEPRDDENFGEGLLEEEPVQTRVSPPAPRAERIETEARPAAEARPAPAAPRPAAEADDFEADDDLPDTPEEAEATDEAGGSEDAPRKRRRRRRRRRSGAEETAPAAASRTDDTAFPEAEEVEADAGAEVEEPAEAESDEGDDRGPRRRRSRRRRRGERGDRGEAAPAREPAAAARAATDSDEDEDLDATDFGSEVTEHPGRVASSALDDEDDEGAESESDDDGVDATINYGDVPTWEEAISYLLRPNTVQVEAGSSSNQGGSQQRSRSAPPQHPDQPKSTRHYRGRKR